MKYEAEICHVGVYTCQLSRLRRNCHASKPIVTLSHLTRLMSRHLEILRPKFIHNYFFNAALIISQDVFHIGPIFPDSSEKYFICIHHTEVYHILQKLTIPLKEV